MLLHAVLIVVAVFLCWLSLRGVQLRDIYATLQLASLKWLAPLAAVTLLSHVIRAWRWQLLLDTLHAQPRVSFTTAFGGTMIGLMVNYALPRVGEIARAAHVSTRSDLRIGATIGTVIAERALDVTILIIGLGASLLYLLERTDAVRDAFVVPIATRLADVTLLPVIVVAVSIAAIVMLCVAAVRRIAILRSLLRKAWLSLRDGLASAARTHRKPALAISSVLMFLLYGVMAFIPLVMFNIAGPFELSYVDGLTIMFIGVLGVAVPSPGGIGSFHYITRVTLVSLFGVPASLAVTYAVFLHGAQLVLYTVVGFIVMIVQGGSIGGLVETTDE